ncbi:MAG: sulfatase, partial [Lachnospiraceae bacterium]
TCALSGKWHLGDSVRQQHGFTKWYTIGMGGCCYYHPDIVENGDIKVEHGRYVTELITDKALDWLKELAGQEAPFYLSVHYTAPHSPWGEEHHPAKWIDYYRDCAFESIPDIPDHPDMTTGPVYGTPKRRENLIGYFAAVSAMDEQVGRILDWLVEFGMERDTIVIFTADNGMSMGQHGIWGKGNGTFPLNMYDTAVKVPFLISWPGHIRGGSLCDELVSAYDLFPTIMELTGIEYGGDGKRCGSSFAALLMEKTGRKTEEIVVFDEYGPVRMIRTKEWKYVHRYPYGRNELYNLLSDPGEMENLYEDPHCKDVVIKMRERLEVWFERWREEDQDGVRQGVTGAGQMCPAGKRADRVNIYAPIELFF